MKGLAHIGAIYIGALVITMGEKAYEFGPFQALFSFLPWLGGFLIWGIIAIATLPLGLALRWVIGQLFRTPLWGALTGGVIVSLAIIPLVHPSMNPSLSFATQPIWLIVTHTLAGIAGGLVWLKIERPEPTPA